MTSQARPVEDDVHGMVSLLQGEIEETNREVVALALELEQRVAGKRPGSPRRAAYGRTLVFE
jgi:hypothetical protein